MKREILKQDDFLPGNNGAEMINEQIQAIWDKLDAHNTLAGEEKPFPHGGNYIPKQVSIDVRKLLDDWHDCKMGLQDETGSGEYIREHMDKILTTLTNAIQK